MMSVEFAAGSNANRTAWASPSKSERFSASRVVDASGADERVRGWPPDVHAAIARTSPIANSPFIVLRILRRRGSSPEELTDLGGERIDVVVHLERFRPDVQARIRQQFGEAPRDAGV